MAIEAPFDLNAELSLSAQSLAVQGKRLQLLAANIANADTPNYKARDLDFRSILSQVKGATMAAPMTKTQSMHMDAPGTASTSANGLKYRQPLTPSLDGNTVDTQLEEGAFSEVNVRYQASLSFANDTFRGLMLAITGQG